MNFNPFARLTKLFPKPPTVSADTVSRTATMSKEDVEMMKRLGVTINDIHDQVFEATTVNYERHALYQEIDKSLSHWMMGAASELYADFATVYSSIHGATMWITANSTKVEETLTKLLNSVAIEEKVFDWAWTTAVYGDLFVRINAAPGLGIISIDDNEHPISVSRIDKDGVLVGFFNTPHGSTNVSSEKLIPPWEFIHLRILSSKRKRPFYNDPSFSEYRTVHLLSPDQRRVTSKYGTSIFTNALPIYKRLRMAEDSLLLARLTKGIKKYIYKIKVDGDNVEAIAEIIDQYKVVLKRARALNDSATSPYYDEKYNPMGNLEDIILPVWGDVNDMMVEEIGGDPDIKWIVDVEDLRNQLASALRTPLSLLGGFVEEATGALGSTSIEKLDIRFARSARRLQRALIDGVTRLCQIHLAYLGMDPDPSQFQVNMSETSTAEEDQIRESLDTSVDVVAKVVDTFVQVFGDEFDKAKLLDYLNKKILKLGDLDINDLLSNVSESVDKKDELKQALTEVITRPKAKRLLPCVADLKAHLPFKESLKEWKEIYGKCMVSFTENKDNVRKTI